MQVKNKRILGRTVLWTLVFMWVCTIGYAFTKYGSYRDLGDEVVCGEVIETKPYQDTVRSGKRDKIVTGEMASVDFGQYGTHIVKLTLEAAFQGVGTRHCEYRRYIDRSVVAPSGWDVFIVLHTALAGTLAGAAGIMLFGWFVVTMIGWAIEQD